VKWEGERKKNVKGEAKLKAKQRVAFTIVWNCGITIGLSPAAVTQEIKVHFVPCILQKLDVMAWNWALHCSVNSNLLAKALVVDLKMRYFGCLFAG